MIPVRGPHQSEALGGCLVCLCLRPALALRASSSGDLVGDTAFSVAAPRAWNTLPTELKLLRSITTFRRQLKTFLFQSGYGHRETD